MLQKRGERKAQITLFVILALVILIAFLILYFAVFRRLSIEDGSEVEEVPEEFKVVSSYVEACIHDVGIKALKEMGMHGGYIDPLDSELTPVLLRYNPSAPTSYELTSLTGDEDGLVPYYLHVPGKSDYLNYRLGSFAPTIQSMEYQLSVYMSRELPKCTRGFKELEKQYDVDADDDNIKTTTYIKDDKIEFYVNYELNLTKENVKARIKQHHNIVRFPFKKYYELALNMMGAELISQFLESFTLSLISYYSGLDSNMLPPMIDYTNVPYVITWSNIKVWTDFSGLLRSYTPTLQVVGTKGYEPITVQGDDVEASFYKSLSMEIFNESLPNIAITFFYPDNTLSMRVQPSKGDRIKPNIEVQEGNQYIPKREFNTYKFYYDVAYPVIVEIRGYEPTTDIPEYSFLFALESNLIENKGVLAWNLGLGTVDWDYSYINTTFTFPEDSIHDADGNPINLKPRSTTKSLFCDEATWLSGEVSLRATDAKHKAPLEGVSVSYGCGDYDECWAGITDTAGEWKGKLPICQGGYLALSKEGYGSKTIMLSTQEGKGALLPTQKLEIIREINASVKKLEIQKIFNRNDDWEWEPGPDSIGLLQGIDEGAEQVILTITQTGFEAGTSPLTNTIIFGREGVSKGAIKLVPSEYEVTANLIDYNGVTIPANCSRVCSKRGLLGIGCTEHTYFPDPEVVLDPAPWGGVEIKTSTTGLLKITSAQLDNSQELDFRVLKLPNLQNSVPPGACLEQLEEMDKIDDYSRTYKAEVMPVFK
ncbi:hypothetical protein AYK26_00940 [Euryarchaeota archaeon SM23-78]|nr:MAG: hypothetical protein AYK26_00940 [Euryarchaeota archaeon SM23-78]MBW3001442.1 hypothetical protein [Candidatus Woesearchaeota archaeon]